MLIYDASLVRHTPRVCRSRYDPILIRLLLQGRKNQKHVSVRPDQMRR